MSRRQIVFRIPAHLQRTLDAYQLALSTHLGVTMLPASRLLTAVLCWRVSYTTERAFQEAHPVVEQEPPLDLNRDALSQAAAMTEATYKADTFLRSRGIKPSQALFDAIRRLPLNPERPELLAPFVELRQQGGQALGELRVRIGARTAHRIRTLAEVWELSPAEVVGVLISTNLAMRLPARVTPPRINAGIAAAAVAEPPAGTEPLEFVVADDGDDEQEQQPGAAP